MRHHLPQKVLHSKGGSHKDTLLCTPLLWDPTGVRDPRLMAFFAIELTQGGNLRFPNLHVTQSIKGPSWGLLVAGWPRQSSVMGRLGVGGRW